MLYKRKVRVSARSLAPLSLAESSVDDFRLSFFGVSGILLDSTLHATG